MMPFGTNRVLVKSQFYLLLCYDVCTLSRRCTIHESDSLWCKRRRLVININIENYPIYATNVQMKNITTDVMCAYLYVVFVCICVCACVRKKSFPYRRHSFYKIIVQVGVGSLSRCRWGLSLVLGINLSRWGLSYNMICFQSIIKLLLIIFIHHIKNIIKI